MKKLVGLFLSACLLCSLPLPAVRADAAAGRVLGPEWTALDEETKTFNDPATGIALPSIQGMEASYNGGALQIKTTEKLGTTSAPVTIPFAKAGGYSSGKIYIELKLTQNIAINDGMRSYLRGTPRDAVMITHGKTIMDGKLSGGAWFPTKVPVTEGETMYLGVELDYDAGRLRLFKNGADLFPNKVLTIGTAANPPTETVAWVFEGRTNCPQDAMIAFDELNIWQASEQEIDPPGETETPEAPDAGETPKDRAGWVKTDGYTFTESNSGKYVAENGFSDFTSCTYEEDYGRLQYEVIKTGTMGDNLSNFVQMPLKAPETGKFYAEVKFMPGFTNTERMRMYLGEVPGKYVALHTMGPAFSPGKASIGSIVNNWINAAGIKAPAFDQNEWKTFGIEVDQDTQIMRYYMNGAEICTERNAGFEGLPIKFAAQHSITNWFWNFQKVQAQGDKIIFDKVELWALDDAAFKEDVASVTLETLTDEDPSDLSHDLNLPSVLQNGTNVAWSSSDEAVIAVNGTTGTLNANGTFDKAVTLTAAFADEVFSETKEFHFVVPQRGKYDKNLQVCRFDFLSNEEKEQVIVEGDGSASVAGGSLAIEKTGGNPVSADIPFGDRGIVLSGETVSVQFALRQETAAQSELQVLDKAGATAVSLTLQNGTVTVRDSENNEAGSFPYVNRNLLRLDFDTITGSAKLYHNGVLETTEPLRCPTAGVSSLKAAVSAGTLYIDSVEALIETGNKDLASVNIDKATLTIDKLTAEPADRISKNLNLEKLTEGITGGKITWTSDKPHVISARGIVSRQAQDETVTVTATIQKGDQRADRAYIFVVKALDPENLAYGCDVAVNDAAPGHEGGLMADALDETYWLQNSTDRLPAVTIALKQESQVSFLKIQEVPWEQTYLIGDFTVEVSTDNVNWTQVYQGSGIGKEKAITFPKTMAKYIKFKVLSKEAGAAGIYEFAVKYVMTDKEAVELDSKTVFDGIPRTISGDIVLPQAGANGTAVAWSSSDETVVTSTGKFTKPNKACTIVLTARISKGNDSVSVRSTHAVSYHQPSGGSGGGGSVRPGGSVTAPVVNIGEPAAPSPTPGTGPAPETRVFNDVDQTNWAYEYIKELKEGQIVSGDADGNFYPKKAVTREEFTKMLVIALDIGKPSEPAAFRDVTSGDWYYEYVAAASASGIVNGISQDWFGVGISITREDMAVMTVRALEAAGVTLEMGEPVTFQDQAAISGYAADSVNKLASAGIVCGDGGGNFHPANHLTREDAAKIISAVRK